MRKHKVFENITYTKVKDCLYNANYDTNEMGSFIKEIIESFTVFKVDKLSVLTDIPIGEEILARIITDNFLKDNEEIVTNALMGVIVNCKMHDLNYKITIAYNKEQLNGIVYSILT